MSTLVSDLITDAFRENNLIPIGSVPTVDEQTEGLNLLNRFVDGLFGYELGENLFQWQLPGTQRTAPVAANFPQLPYPQFPQGPPLVTTGAPGPNVSPYPPQNCRIVYGGQIPMTVWLPETPNDGARMALVSTAEALAAAVLTVDSNGRGFLQNGASVAVSTLSFTPPITPIRWFYRADEAQWVQMGNMSLTGNSIFPEAFDNLLITATAYRLSARTGVTVAPATSGEMAQQIKRLKSRFKQKGVTVYGSENFPRSQQSFIAGSWWV